MEQALQCSTDRRSPFWRRTAKVGVVLGLAGLGYLAWRRWGKKVPKITFNPNRGESHVDGSSEAPRCEPKTQVKLGYASKTGTIEVVGCGFRVEFGGRSFLMTAAHNVATGEPLYVIKGTKIELISKYEPILCGYDSALIEISHTTWSRLGVSVATLTAIGSTSAYVDIVGVAGSGTSGQLSPTKNVVGMVEYTGSTYGGYSGAVYHNGNSVYGMHTTGGRTNMGVAAMFLLHAAKIALSMRDEAYDRAFYNRLRRQRTMGNQVTFLGDYAIVETQSGYFHRFPKEDWLRFENETAQEEYAEEAEELSEDNFFDEVPESTRPLNSSRPGSSRAGKPSPLGTEHKMLRALDSIQKSLGLLTKNSKPVYLNRSRSKLQQARSTSPPKREQQPSSKPSTSTQ